MKCTSTCCSRWLEAVMPTRVRLYDFKRAISVTEGGGRVTEGWWL